MPARCQAEIDTDGGMSRF
ncbi:Bgt-51911 [Blumeria graminis f. sp. tritici]|uniref:Bgt-51911 n=1 Tax=Blumeria graminis f. sp. tritici TaxID=62690 RepID=A0A9X9MFT6_BLUGR|nr:Bgt-51911 [Blumeria graminis f. sp. tritici]